MKLVGVLIVGLALVACAPQPTLEQLEDQAMLTGDWSQVEKRERQIKRRAARDAADNFVCPQDMAAICEKRFGDTRCTCVDRHSMRDIFANF